MSTIPLDNQIGKALVDFSTNGAFPEEEAVSAAYVTSSLLPTVLGALTDAKIELEVLQIPKVYILS
jgi:centromere/kinetochore protein ZW10